MARRKRAPGGGRKAQGEFSGLGEPTSVRMSADLLKQLDRAAKESSRRTGRRISRNQELLARLERSFSEGRERDRSRALQAFCFLFSEALQTICVDLEIKPNWRFDPWLFAAFKLAVGKILDRFQPSGKKKLPEFWQFFAQADVEGFPMRKEEREQITRSPEAMAEYAVRKVLSDFTDTQRVEQFYKGFKVSEETMNDPRTKQIFGQLAKQWESTHYDMSKARRDLAPKQTSKGEK